MDVKKSRTAASMDGRKIVTFVGDVKQELKKVEWTSKDELKSYTKIVLASTALLAIFIYFIDLVMQGFMNMIHFLVKFITG